MVAIPVSGQKLDEGGRFIRVHYIINIVKFYANL